MPSSVQALRQQIASYVEDRSKVDDLWRRLTSAVVAANASSADPNLDALSGLVLLRLYEFQNGDWTEPQLKRLLRTLLSPAPPLPGQPDLVMQELLVRIAAVAERRLGSEDFEDWFLCAAWSVEQFDNETLSRLFYDTLKLWSEFTAGQRNDSDYREALSALVRERLPVAG